MLLTDEELYPWAVAVCLRKFVRGRAEVVCVCVGVSVVGGGGRGGGEVDGGAQHTRRGAVGGAELVVTITS